MENILDLVILEVYHNKLTFVLSDLREEETKHWNTAERSLLETLTIRIWSDNRINHKKEAFIIRTD